MSKGEVLWIRAAGFGHTVVPPENKKDTSVRREEISLPCNPTQHIIYIF